MLDLTLWNKGKKRLLKAVLVSYNFDILMWFEVSSDFDQWLDSRRPHPTSVNHCLRFWAALSRSSQHNSASGSPSLISALTNSAWSSKSCWTKSRYFLYWTSQIRRVGVLFVISQLWRIGYRNLVLLAPIPCSGIALVAGDEWIVISTLIFIHFHMGSDLERRTVH